MRSAIAILGLVGCRSLLGFDEVVRVDDAPSSDRVDSSPTDGPVDMPRDAPGVSCPVDYVTITGGQAGHKYKTTMVQTNWNAMHDFCVTSGGYLAIPNDAAELSAIFTLTSTDTWVGVTDQQIEGTIVDVLNNPYTALAINNNSGTRDCGQAKNDPPIEFELCSNGRAGVCECEE